MNLHIEKLYEPRTSPGVPCGGDRRQLHRGRKTPQRQPTHRHQPGRADRKALQGRAFSPAWAWGAAHVRGLCAPSDPAAHVRELRGGRSPSRGLSGIAAGSTAGRLLRPFDVAALVTRYRKRFPMLSISVDFGNSRILAEKLLSYDLGRCRSRSNRSTSRVSSPAVQEPDSGGHRAEDGVLGRTEIDLGRGIDGSHPGLPRTRIRDAGGARSTRRRGEAPATSPGSVRQPGRNRKRGRRRHGPRRNFRRRRACRTSASPSWRFPERSYHRRSTWSASASGRPAN